MGPFEVNVLSAVNVLYNVNMIVIKLTKRNSHDEVIFPAATMFF